MTEEIGAALVDIRADQRKFLADLEKIKAELEKLNARATVLPTLARGSVAHLQGQLDRIKSLVVKVKPKVLKSDLETEFNRFVVPPKVNVALDFGDSLKNLNAESDLFKQLDKTLSSINNLLSISAQLTVQQVGLDTRRNQVLGEVNETVGEINTGLAQSIPFIDQQRKGLRDTQSNLRRALATILNMNKIKDPLPVIVATNLSSELLLSSLARILKQAFLLRKEFIKIGVVGATSFAAIANTVGAAVAQMDKVIGGLVTLGGLGVLAVGIKLQLEDAEVKQSVEELKATFTEVGTRASASLKPVIIGFNQDLQKSLRVQEKAFTDFFNQVSPALEDLGQAFNTFLQSEKFSKLIGLASGEVINFLSKFAANLPKIIQGIEDISKKFLEISPRIREALGPSLFEGLSVESFNRGLERFTDILENASAGIQSFKTNFKTVFSEAIDQVEGFSITMGKVGDSLFNSLGVIGVQAVEAFGSVLNASLISADTALGKSRDSVAEFIDVLGVEAASAILILGETLGHVIDRAAQLGTILAPLLTVFADLSKALEPVVGPIFDVLDTVGALAVEIGQTLVPIVERMAAVLAPVVEAFNILATIVAGVLHPALALLGGPLAGLVGTFAAVIATMVGFKVATAGIGAALDVMKGKFSGAAAGTGILATSIRTLKGVLATSVTSFAALGGTAGRIRGQMTSAAVGMINFANAGKAGSVSSRLAAAATNQLIAANIRAGSSGAIAAAGTRLMAATTATMGAAARVGSLALRGLGAAFRFALGPIGLLLIAIELVIHGFEGLVQMGKGVAKVLKGIFTLDLGLIKEGFNEVVEGGKNAVKGVADAWTGKGDEVGQEFTEELKGKLDGFKFDAAAAGNAGGQSFLDQFKGTFQNLDFSAQLGALKGAFAEGGLLSAESFIDAATGALNAQGRLTASLAEGLGINEDFIESFRQTGDLAGSGLLDALRNKMLELENLPALEIENIKALKALGESMKAAGDSGGQALIDAANAALRAGKPAVEAATKEIVPKTVEQAKVTGKNAGSDVINSMTELLRASGPKISDTIVKAFELSAPGTQIRIGQAVNNMLIAAFANMQTSGLVLAATIQNVMTGAFSFALLNMSSLVGQQINTMLVTAFATMQTSGLAIAASIQSVLTGAFTFALLNMSSLVGQQINNMLVTAFATMQTSGLAIAASIQNVLTGAFTFALLNLPSAIGQGVNQALTTGVQLGLNGFGLSIQGVINAAFIAGFSGVGGAIQAPLSAAFLGAMGLVNSFATTIRVAMVKAVDGMETAVKPVERSIAQSFKVGFTAAVQAAQTGSNEITAVLRQTILIIENMDFFSPGYRIGARLADGIRASIPLVAAAADDMAAAVANRVPQSPPKEGPLSGKGDPLQAGARIVERLVAGIKSQESQLKATLDQLLQNPQFSRNFQVGFNRGIGFPAPRGAISGSELRGTFNKSIGGSILRQDTSAQLSGGTTNNRQIQIRPGTINVSIANADDPRQFLNELSTELINLTTAR